MAKIRISRSSAPILKWQEIEPGTIFDVKFHGIREGEYGSLANVTVLAGGPPTGDVTMPVKTNLEPLRRVRAGALVTIVFHGMVKGKKSEFYSFDVDVDEADVTAEPLSQKAAW
jgi:hypothetical protein